MKKEKKTREHRFLNRHTIAGALLLMFGGFLVCNVLAGVIGGMISHENGVGAGGIVGSILALILWVNFWKPEYNWKLAPGDWGRTFKLLLPVLAYWILMFGMFGAVAGGVPFGALPLSSILAAIMAGVSEELVFREMGISYLARQWRDEKKIIPMALIPAAAFSLTHLTNISVNSDVGSLLTQVLLTMFFGFFYSAVYLRTGNIWPLILVHALHDLLAFSASEGVTAMGVEEFPDWTTGFLIVIEAALAVWGLYLLRKSKRAEILELWDRKWSRTEKVE